MRSPEPGSILIVDLPDMDYQSGTLLATYKPRAVLNASSGATGRGLGTGSAVLIDAGVIVVDDMGSDVMELRDGDSITLTGPHAARKDTLIASGRVFVVNEDVYADGVTPAKERLSQRIEAQALAAARDFEAEADLILNGVGLPPSRVNMDGRLVLVATPTTDFSGVAKRVKQFVGDNNPVIIAAGKGADALYSIGLRPAVIVSDPRDLNLKKLGRTRQVLVPAAAEEIPARDLLKRHSIAFDAVRSALTTTDIALLFAASNGAKAIIDCSAPKTLEQYFDDGGVQVTGSTVVAAKLSGRVVPLSAMLAAYRPRISSWWLALLFVAALVAAASAFFLTPMGQGLLFGAPLGQEAPIEAVSATVDLVPGGADPTPVNWPRGDADPTSPTQIF